MDLAIIIILVLAMGAIVFSLIKTHKKGGCASCPYNDGCTVTKSTCSINNSSVKKGKIL